MHHHEAFAQRQGTGHRVAQDSSFWGIRFALAICFARFNVPPIRLPRGVASIQKSVTDWVPSSTSESGNQQRFRRLQLLACADLAYDSLAALVRQASVLRAGTCRKSVAVIREDVSLTFKDRASGRGRHKGYLQAITGDWTWMGYGQRAMTMLPMNPPAQIWTTGIPPKDHGGGVHVRWRAPSVVEAACANSAHITVWCAGMSVAVGLKGPRQRPARRRSAPAPLLSLQRNRDCTGRWGVDDVQM